jgi:hypothetical protein
LPETQSGGTMRLETLGWINPKWNKGHSGRAPFSGVPAGSFCWLQGPVWHKRLTTQQGCLPVKSKATLVLAPPLIALTVMIALIWDQRRETRPAEGSDAATEEAAKHRRSRPESGAEPSVIDPEKSGWKRFATRMWSLTENGDPASMHALTAYQERIGRMSADELDAAMDSLDGISFPDPEARNRLMGTFCRQMCGKAPARLLARARDGMENGRFTMTWNLREALTKVAATSPREAVAWMDDVIAKGAFDHSGANRYSPMWLDYEKALVCGLIPADSALAEQRLAALPEEVRPSLLRDELTGPSGDPATQPAYLSICRKFLDEDEMCERDLIVGEFRRGNRRAHRGFQSAGAD